MEVNFTRRRMDGLKEALGNVASQTRAVGERVAKLIGVELPKKEPAKKASAKKATARKVPAKKAMPKKEARKQSASQRYSITST